MAFPENVQNHEISIKCQTMVKRRVIIFQCPKTKRYLIYNYLKLRQSLPDKWFEPLTDPQNVLFYFLSTD